MRSFYAKSKVYDVAMSKVSPRAALALEFVSSRKEEDRPRVDGCVRCWVCRIPEVGRPNYWQDG